MKLLFVLLALTCIASVNCGMIIGIWNLMRSPDSNTDNETKLRNCATQNKMNEQMVHDFMKNRVFPTTEETKAFPTCIAKTFGIMNEDGTLTKEFMDDSQNEKCKNMGGKDLNETAAKVIECILKDEKRTLAN